MPFRKFRNDDRLRILTLISILTTDFKRKFIRFRMSAISFGDLVDTFDRFACQRLIDVSITINDLLIICEELHSKILRHFRHRQRGAIFIDHRSIEHRCDFFRAGPLRDLCRFHRVTFKFSNRNIRPVDITAIITVYDKTDLLCPYTFFQGDQLIGLSDRRIGTVHRREVITVISRDIDMIAFNVQTLPDDTEILDPL